MNHIISIITCTYNSSKYLTDCLDSIKSQTNQNIEHIIIDSGSTDETLMLINAYQRNVNYPVKIINSRLLGISNAMNEGLSFAKGTYINILHSDDMFYDKNVIKIVNDFISNNNDWIIGDCEFFGSVNRCVFPNHKIYRLVWKFFPNLLIQVDNLIPHPSVFIKKDIIISAYGFDESYKALMDYDLWLKLFRLGYRPFFTDLVLSKYRSHFETTSNKLKLLAKSELNKIECTYSITSPKKYLLNNLSKLLKLLP